MSDLKTTDRDNCLEGAFYNVTYWIKSDNLYWGLQLHACAHFQRLRQCTSIQKVLGTLVTND